MKGSVSAPSDDEGDPVLHEPGDVVDIPREAVELGDQYPCLKLGAAPDDLVPFEKYEAAHVSRDGALLTNSGFAAFPIMHNHGAGLAGRRLASWILS